MISLTTFLRAVAIFCLLVVTTSEAFAIPILKPSIHYPTTRRTTKNTTKPVNPLQLAVNDLQTAKKALDNKKTSEANHYSLMAKEIIGNQRQIAMDASGEANKVRSANLKAINAIIREGRQHITESKPDEAKASFDMAIKELNDLMGIKPKTPEKKKA